MVVVGGSPTLMYWHTVSMYSNMPSREARICIVTWPAGRLGYV